MKINIHAGHNPSGRIACGSVGFLNESTEARKIKDEVIFQLRGLGHTVYDCTCDDGKSQSDVLRKIVSKCNEHTVDLDVSIHLNSGAKDEIGNGKTTGVECWCYSTTSKSVNTAVKICEEIAQTGFKNRGVKYSTSLYVLKNTNSPATLIEVCFVDDKDDANVYDYRRVANAIVRSLVGINYYEDKILDDILPEEEEHNSNSMESNKKLYRLQLGAFTNYSNCQKLQKELKQKGYDCFITN